MPIQRKPEEIVPVLLTRLEEKARLCGLETINESNERDTLGSKFKDIQREISSMERLFPTITRWEEELMVKFRALEQEIDKDDVFKQPVNDSEINDQLDRISEKVVEIRELSRTEQNRLMERISTMSSGDKLLFEEGGGKDQTVSEKWSQLGEDEKIYASKAMSNFQKSFDCLESDQLKACSLYLPIFPENISIKKRCLIYWWIGEGMVTETDDKTAEEVGEDVFKELINEGFIIPKCEDFSPSINSCIVHPWVRRMLILVAGRLSFFEFAESRMPCNGHQRVFLSAGHSDSHSEMAEDTLTVFNVNEQYLEFKPGWLSKSNRIKVLQLGRWQNSVKHHIEVENEDSMVVSKKKKKVEYEVSLNGLGTQTSLRYLSLRGVSRMTTLPHSILNLTSLVILDLRACHNLENLPSGISSLKNLTHLDVSECYLLESMPKGVEDLFALQVLKGFVIGNVRRNPCNLSDLARLTSLRKLSIRIGNEALGDGNLNELNALQILVISWGIVPSQSSTDAALGSFSFPSNLKKLDLRCVPIKAKPEWLVPGSLVFLEKLYIRGGELSSLNHDDEQNWKIKILRLKYLKNLKVTEQELRKMFPEVEYLEKVKCNKVKGGYDEDIIPNKIAHKKTIVATS